MSVFRIFLRRRRICALAAVISCVAWATLYYRFQRKQEIPFEEELKQVDDSRYVDEPLHQSLILNASVMSVSEKNNQMQIDVENVTTLHAFLNIFYDNVLSQFWLHFL